MLFCLAALASVVPSVTELAFAKLALRPLSPRQPRVAQESILSPIWCSSMGTCSTAMTSLSILWLSVGD
ncbi:hypothetical protein KC333_g16 [Hortaea werneckii]|nr:hypothetical protein KC333_g16 [Hortaea werneckii]